MAQNSLLDPEAMLVSLLWLLPVTAERALAFFVFKEKGEEKKKRKRRKYFICSRKALLQT